jgi:DNA-binding response OmpR family regulator
MTLVTTTIAPVEAAREIAAFCEDFLRRPYDREDLFARIRRVLAKAENAPSDTLARGELDIDTTRKRVAFRGKPVTLRRAEFEVLLRLARAWPAPVSQAELVMDVLGTHGSGGAVRNQVYEVRKKLAAAGARHVIETLSGRGAYRLIV